jgi:ABC-type spermidine/putrescine transport system permease subunit I
VPFGSAIAVLMLVLTLIVLFVMNRIAPEQSADAARR